MWFEVGIVVMIFVVGNIFFGYFEEGMLRWWCLFKMVFVMGILFVILSWFGCVYFWVFLGSLLLFVIYIYVWWLLSRGVNGWIGELKYCYYELCGWVFCSDNEDGVVE